MRRCRDCGGPLPPEPPNKYVCDGCRAKARPGQLARAQSRRRAEVRRLLAQVPPPGSLVLDPLAAEALQEGLRLLAEASDRHEALLDALDADESVENETGALEARDALADAAAAALARWRSALPQEVLPQAPTEDGWTAPAAGERAAPAGADPSGRLPPGP